MLHTILVIAAIVSLGLYTLGVKIIPRLGLDTLGLGLLLWLLATIA